MPERSDRLLHSVLVHRERVLVQRLNRLAASIQHRRIQPNLIRVLPQRVLAALALNLAPAPRPAASPAAPAPARQDPAKAQDRDPPSAKVVSQWALALSQVRARSRSRRRLLSPSAHTTQAAIIRYPAAASAATNFYCEGA